MPKTQIRDLGPCIMTWDGTDLGPTFGGVIFKDETIIKDVLEDQNGETPVDAVPYGKAVTVESPLTRTSLAVLQTMIGGAEISSNTLDVSNIVGATLYESAAELIIKPKVNGVASVDTDEWVHFYKAYPINKIEVPYGPDQKTFMIEWKIFPVADTGADYQKMYRFGPAV